MSLKPKNTVEDGYADGLTCALCESPDLQVVHLDKYPDFVSCGSCGSAFVVENEGDWIMYGKFNADLPETREFALRQWTWLDAVRQRAADERSSRIEEQVEGTVPPAAEIPLPAADEMPAEAELETEEIIPGALPASPPETQEKVEPISPSVFPEAKEFTRPEDIPVHIDRAEEMDSDDELAIGQFDEVQQSRLEQVAAPTGDAITEEPVEAESGDPPASLEATLEDSGLPVPDWLEQKPAEGADEIISTGPFSEESAEEAIGITAAVPPFIGEPSESIPPTPEVEIPGIPEEDPQASAEAADFLDLLRQTDEPPTFSLPEEMEDTAFPGLEDTPAEFDQDVPGLEEIDAPIEEHLLPPWARGEVEDEGAAPPMEIDDSPIPPILGEPTEEKFIPEEPFAFSPEKPASAEPVVERAGPAPATSVVEAPPPEEPEEGFRHRVVVEGDRLTFPKNVCSHCLRMPVSLAAAVRGTLPDPSTPGIRRPLTFKLPLCNDCERRAKAPTPEERSARIQAHAISGIVAVFLMLLALIFKLARFDPNAFEGILVLLIVGVLGYGIPAVLLLNRAGNYPPPYDAAYVLTTLRVLDDAGEGRTAFEWRNQGYAELFRQVNRQNAKGSTAKVEDTMLVVEPEPVPPAVEDAAESMEQAFEHMIAEAQVSETEAEIPHEPQEEDKLDSLEQAFWESSPPDEGSQEQV